MNCHWRILRLTGLALLVGLSARAATTIQFNVPALTGIGVTNRSMLITPIALFPDDPTQTPAYDRQRFTTDTNGMIGVSNMMNGLYQCDVQRPPDATRFYIQFTNAGAFAQAGMWVVVPGAETISPPHSVAYSAQASDARYSQGGPGGSTNWIQNANGAGTNTTLSNPAITNLSSGNAQSLRMQLGLMLPGDIPSITSFLNDQYIVEMGHTVNATVLNWTLAGAPVTEQFIDNGISFVPTGTFTATDDESYTSNRTYTLTVGNNATNITAKTTVAFEQKNYWGASALASLTDYQIISLSSAFATGLAQSRTITASNQFIYVAYPASYGAATFTVNGLLNTAWNLTTRSFTNASGFGSSYNIYQSQNLLSGTYIVTLQ
jgi:hypothetical protein